MSDGKKVGAVLVVGGGPAGIQAALDLADSGFKVYILEAGLSIGGTMAQLDKTFPTNGRPATSRSLSPGAPGTSSRTSARAAACARSTAPSRA